MVGIWHEITTMSSKINMLNQNKCFFMGMGSKKEVTEKQFSGSYAKVSDQLRDVAGFRIGAELYADLMRESGENK